MRMLIWLALAVAVLYALHRITQPRLDRNRQDGDRQDADKQGKSRPPQELEAMVPCAHCGVHLPASEALADPAAGGAFCCPEHRQRHLDSRR